MNEHLYSIPSAFIAGALLLSMAAAKEIGYRTGLRKGRGGEKQAREHIHAIQNSILGILALLLGFTFSLALQRFDARSEAVVDEANAIGNAWFRAGFLSEPLQTQARNSLRQYADLRIQSSRVSLINQPERQTLLKHAVSLQESLSALARQAASSDPASIVATPFTDAIQNLGETFRRRQAGLDRHVPEMVLLLLYTTFLVASSIIGYAAGVADHRPSVVSYLLVLLVVILVFIILDLDRPRRGFIEINQKSLLELQSIMTDPVTLPPR
jgi:hypothetical protein